MKRFISLSCVLLFSLFASFAQYSFLSDSITKGWTALDGLPGNAIMDVIQKSDGYLYIGTYEGLVRFDGVDFTVYNKNNGNLYDFVSVRSIFEDSKGNLWVGSNDEGVEKIASDGTKEFFSVQRGLQNNSIRAIIEDKGGNIWIGTASGVVYVTPEGGVVYPAGLDSYGAENCTVLKLFCDSSGRVWLLTTDSEGIYYFVHDSFQKYDLLSADFPGFFPTAISQDSFGAFWIALGSQGIVHIQNHEITKIESGTLIDNCPTQSIHHDLASSSTWFGTERGSVLYRAGKFFEYSTGTALDNNTVNKIIGDREGSVWIATDSAGIHKISPGKFRTNNFGTTVNAIAQGHDGLFWIGTDNGLMCFQGDIEVENELTLYCAGKRIRHVEIAMNGDVLVSCYTAPAQVRYSKTDGIKNWTASDGLAGNRTRVAIEASNGDVYVGTTSGLSIIRTDGTIRTYHTADGFANEYIMCIYEDNDGVIWVGTDGGGIYFMKDEEIKKKITTENGLAGNVVFKITQDAYGVYWICTGLGISRYKKQEARNVIEDRKISFINYTAANGLSADSIFQTVFDLTGNVWMTSNRGISSVSYAELEEIAEGKRSVVDSKFYNQNDGLSSLGATSTSLSMCDSYGRTWFTLVDGFAVYDPTIFMASSVLPIVHIESISIDDKVFRSFSEEIEIPAGTKRIDIKYTGLSFTSPERVRFKYMMEGFDDDYSGSVSSRTVSYTNLRPGHYKFSVNACNSEEAWSNNPASVNFYQVPFFYEKVSFWIVLAILIVGIVMAIFASREHRNRVQQEKLENMVQLRTEELQHERDKSESLLRNILPVTIADRLKENDATAETIAEMFDGVTVLFADIVGFTTLSSKYSAKEMVSALNDLFSRFDERALREGVEKIKTIGDAYMAACGVPVANKAHVAVMIRFAKGMYKDLAEYNLDAEIKFKMRIGINSGHAMAGVIGKNKFIYDLWGDTVNIASRMESLCRPGKIRIPESVARYVYNNKLATLVYEEACEVKGKGMMRTFEIGNLSID